MSEGGGSGISGKSSSSSSSTLNNNNRHIEIRKKIMKDLFREVGGGGNDPGLIVAGKEEHVINLLIALMEIKANMWKSINNYNELNNNNNNNNNELNNNNNNNNELNNNNNNNNEPNNNKNDNEFNESNNNNNNNEVILKLSKKLMAKVSDAVIKNKQLAFNKKNNNNNNNNINNFNNNVYDVRDTSAELVFKVHQLVKFFDAVIEYEGLDGGKKGGALCGEEDNGGRGGGCDVEKEEADGDLINLLINHMIKDAIMEINSNDISMNNKNNNNNNNNNYNEDNNNSNLPIGSSVDPEKLNTSTTDFELKPEVSDATYLRLLTSLAQLKVYNEDLVEAILSKRCYYGDDDDDVYFSLENNCSFDNDYVLREYSVHGVVNAFNYNINKINKNNNTRALLNVLATYVGYDNDPKIRGGYDNDARKKYVKKDGSIKGLDNDLDSDKEEVSNCGYDNDEVVRRNMESLLRVLGRLVEEGMVVLLLTIGFTS